MKLSQKLLALGGVTLADYACCPYDDYGMPHQACTDALPEKTPFSLHPDWRNGACKAWESNVDATYDGNDNNCGTNENWGSCGFQRHFPWNEVNTENYRNRGCLVTYDYAAQTTTQGDGCHCNNYADTEENYAGNKAIECKSEKMHAGSNASPSSNGGSCAGGVYTANSNTDANGNNLLDVNGAQLVDGSGVPLTQVDLTAEDLQRADICCDPALDDDTENNQNARVDCFRDCTATDIDGLATCYEDDFLGRRNIQGQSLFVKNAAQYSAGSTTELEFSWTSNAAATTTRSSGNNNNSQLYNLAGVPFLGGVCKLFVPVPRSRVTSVQIAGVHVNINGPSVFAAKVGNDDSYTQDGVSDTHVGTAYCFSVVNPAEGMNNSNGIHNGNVAGGAVGSNPVFAELSMTGTSLQRQAGLEPNINFYDGSDSSHIGTQMKDDLADTVNTYPNDANGNPQFQNGSPIASGDSEVGANFDVVVHIHSEWCNSQSFWNYADMQLDGDYNNGNNDYPLNLAPGQNQFTAAAYAEGQTGTATVNGLQLEMLQDVADNNQDAEDTLATAFATARTNLNSGDCFDSITPACGTAFDAYMTAYFANEDCTAAGTCTTQAADLVAAQNALFQDTDTNDELDTGCMVTGAGTFVAGCTATGVLIDQVTNFIENNVDVSNYRAAIIATTAAEAAVTAAQNNGFTHAHMDLVDKRHNMVATWNNVYEQSGDYLQFPHSADDAFTQIDGTQGTYSAASEYLRWPNAGAFAAFYSFITCANPPHIHETATNVEPAVNPFSVIYNSGSAVSKPDDNSESSQYTNYGKYNLEDRVLVMSQSDSDYRDENCDARIFRGNLRQVGYGVTVCGPGQLPDTDDKRCSWNWNYYSSSSAEIVGSVANDADGNAWAAVNAKYPQSPPDAEEWFDRNNPNSFDMWSTRKRRSASANARKYAFNAGYWGVQQNQPSQTNNAWNQNDANGNPLPFNADGVHGAAIEIPIQDYNFNLVFKTASGESPAQPEVATGTNAANCFFNDHGTGDAVDCQCRPSIRSLTGFTTQAGDAITFTPVADDADAFTFDFSTFTDVVHSSCTAGANNICTADEINDIKGNLQLDACDGYKVLDAEGFRQTDNVQSLVFDDPRIKTSLNPSLNPMQWEVSVQCSRTDQANIGSDVAQRDLFPDCFFGDELWFTFSYSTSANGGQNSYDSYVSAWTSSAATATKAYIST